MNKVIIEQFENLVAYTKFKIKEIEETDSETQENKLKTYKIKLRQLTKILNILKDYPEKITEKNLDELLKIDGIGKGTITRVIEILETKKLSELDEFVKKGINLKVDKNKVKIINELEEVINIGNKLAIDLYNQGIKSVKDLKSKHKKGLIELNEKVQLGLKYYGLVKREIPREEIDQINIFLQKKLSKLNKSEDLNDNNKYCLVICGSYRREKDYSNDIDVLLTKFGTKKGTKDKTKHLEKFLDFIELNNKKKFLIDDLTEKSSPTKYMGFCKFNDNPIRRIDIRYIPYSSYFPALLYFTGSRDLNTRMRKIAKKMGYKINEYSLTDENGEEIKVKSEKSIFNFLGLEYIEPKLR